MSVRRVLIDIELEVDDTDFKTAALVAESTGVHDVSDPDVRDAVSRMLMRFDWPSIGALPLRSLVTARPRQRGGWYSAIRLPQDRGVGPVPL